MRSNFQSVQRLGQPWLATPTIMPTTPSVIELFMLCPFMLLVLIYTRFGYGLPVNSGFIASARL